MLCVWWRERQMPVSQEGEKKATGKKEMADRQWDSFCFNFPSFVFFCSPLWITVLSLLVFWTIDLRINLNFTFFSLFPNIHLENTRTPHCLILARPTGHFQIDLPRVSGVVPWLEAQTGGQEIWAAFPARSPRLCSAHRSPLTCTAPACARMLPADKPRAGFVWPWFPAPPWTGRVTLGPTRVPISEPQFALLYMGNEKPVGDYMELGISASVGLTGQTGYRMWPFRTRQGWVGRDQRSGKRSSCGVKDKLFCSSASLLYEDPGSSLRWVLTPASLWRRVAVKSREE